MTDQLTSIITLLEQRKTAIENALTALREVGADTATTQATTASSTMVETSGRKYKLSAEARERMSQGQRKRYAHLHTVPEPATAATVQTSGRKGKKRTAAQRKRMAEGQRKRYAALRGDSEAAVTPVPETPKRKISAAGIKNIVAATKARWAKVRAEAKAAQELADSKKAARKKSAAKAVKKAAPGKKTAAVAAADEVPF